MDYGQKIGSIKLNTIAEVKRFPDIVTQFESDISLVHKRSVIDGTSLMGIFSLDLSEPVDLYIVERNDGDKDRLVNQLKAEGYNLCQDSQ